MKEVIEVGSDPEMTLTELKEVVCEWIAMFGEDATFFTDAGYNNVELKIIVDRRGNGIQT